MADAAPRRRPGLAEVELVVVETTGDAPTDVPSARHRRPGRVRQGGAAGGARRPGRPRRALGEGPPVGTAARGPGAGGRAAPGRAARRASSARRSPAWRPARRVATGSVRRRAQLAVLRPDLDVRRACAATSTPGSAKVARRRRHRGGRRPRSSASAATDRGGRGAVGPSRWCRRSARARWRWSAAATTTAARDRLAKIESSIDRGFVDLERAFLAELGGGCDLPVGAHAHLDHDGQSSSTRSSPGRRACGGTAATGRLSDHAWVEDTAREAAAAVGSA